MKIRDSDVFVFTLSPSSLESQACLREYSYAAQLGKTILPVIVAEEVLDELVPEALAKIQYVDYRQADKAALGRLSKALHGLSPSGPLPVPLPGPPAVPLSYLVGLREQIETSEYLSFDQQTSIVLKLKQRLHEEEVEQVSDLLRRLRSRDDLYAKVAAEIDSVLRDAKGLPIPSKPIERKPSGTDDKPVSRKQSLLELVPAKIAWLSLLIGAIFNGIWINIINSGWPIQDLLWRRWYWMTSLVSAGVLLTGYAVWRKFASRPLPYKLTSLGGSLGFAMLIWLLGKEFYEFDNEHLWARTLLALFVLFFFVVISFLKDTPSAPVPFKTLLWWVAGGMACAFYLGLLLDGQIIPYIGVVLGAAVVSFVLGVSWKSLQELKTRNH